MPDRRCDSAFACIRAAVRRSHPPEDPAHAEDTLRWLLSLCPDADDALRIAALGHDIERALPDGRVLREEYAGCDAFKQAHARRSAAILAELLHRCGFDAAFVADVASLIARRE